MALMLYFQFSPYHHFWNQTTYYLYRCRYRFILLTYINTCTYKYSLLQTHTPPKLFIVWGSKKELISNCGVGFVYIHSKQLVHTFDVVQTTNTTATCLDMMYPNNPARIFLRNEIKFWVEKWKIVGWFHSFWSKIVNWNYSLEKERLLSKKLTVEFFLGQFKY